MNVFFDFDGTLIDSKRRLYDLFTHIVGNNQLTFDNYWQLKRRKIDHETILKNYLLLDQERIIDFQKKWFENIEDKKYLELDRPFIGTTEFLGKLKNQFSINLYLVTSRQFLDGVIWQLNKFGWENIFKEILVTGQIIEKYELIRDKIKTNSSDLLIGDTGKDILTGKQLGIITIAVLSGFRNKTVLKSYNPDYIYKIITQIELGEIIEK